MSHIYRVIIKNFISAFLRSLRKTRALTQEEMAERLRISSRAYNDLERGKYCVSASVLIFILLLLNEQELHDFLYKIRIILTALDK